MALHLYLYRIDCLIITFILKCKIKIVPVEFYIPVSAFIYLTPVKRKLIHKVNPLYLLCLCLITIILGSGTISVCVISDATIARDRPVN